MSRAIDKEIHFEIKKKLNKHSPFCYGTKTVVLLNIANENIEFIQQKMIQHMKKMLQKYRCCC